jgi:hypothetical protein
MQQQNAFTTFRILHAALLIGLTLFIIISLVVTLLGFHKADEQLQRTLQVVCILVSTISVIGGFNIFRKRIFAARNSLGTGEERMEQYRAACILWWALIEGPGLLATISFLLSGNYAFFALAVVHLLILLAFMPRKANIILLLNLTPQEVARLEGKEGN